MPAGPHSYWNHGDMVGWLLWLVLEWKDTGSQAYQKDASLQWQIGAPSHSEALTFPRDFNQTNIYWKDNTAGHKQYGKFLKCDVNFLLQVAHKPTGRGSLLGLLTNKEGLLLLWCSRTALAVSDHGMVAFKIFGAVKRSTASSLPWTSGEETVCLVEYHWLASELHLCCTM